MSKEKYYYSEDLREGLATIVYNTQGKILSVTKIQGCENHLPRLTICGIYNKEKMTMSYGVAKCSERDIFLRKIGQRISYGRAVSKPYLVIKINKEDKVSEVFITNARKIEQEILSNQ